MRFEWEKFKKFDDGSKSTRCYFRVYSNSGEELQHGWVEDHTLPEAKLKDRECYRSVPYAYAIHISDIHDKTFFDICKEHGIADSQLGCAGYSMLGVCPNEDKDECSPYCGTPRYDVDMILDIVEEAICREYYFDYNKELERLKSHLDAQKALMDEADAYLEKKGRELEGEPV